MQLAPRRWGTARTELGSSHSSRKGSRLLSTPATAACLTCRPDIVCPNRLGGMMQPARAAHGAFLARRKLAASGSSRAPCAFPSLRCCPRCWLFSCLGFEFPTPFISPKEHQKERCGHSRPQRSFITFHGALRNILLSAGFPAMFHMITLEQAFVNSPLQKKFLLLMLLNRIDSIPASEKAGTLYLRIYPYVDPIK